MKNQDYDEDFFADGVTYENAERSIESTLGMKMPVPRGGWELKEAEVRKRGKFGFLDEYDFKPEDVAETKTALLREMSERWKPETRDEYERDLAETEKERQRGIEITVADFKGNGFHEHHIRQVLAGGLEDTAAMRHVREFHSSDKGALVLVGGVGTGKTLAATRLAMCSGAFVGMVSANAIERAGRYDDAMKTFFWMRGFVVIDDLGVEYLDGKGAFRSLLDGIIDQIYGARSRLVITSNLDKDTLTERYGERVMSRLAEIGTLGHCGAEDLRRRKK